MGQPRLRFLSPQRADWRERRAAFERDLAAAGPRVLNNTGTQVRDDLYLAGVDDFMHGEPDLERALAGSSSGATLLMSHNPDLLPEVPPAVGLTLCGHTHGGQVRLPLVGALSTASRYGQRFAQGWVEGPARGFVSRGLSMTAVPLRLNCPAEVVMFDLRPA